MTEVGRPVGRPTQTFCKRGHRLRPIKGRNHCPECHRLREISYRKGLTIEEVIKQERLLTGFPYLHHRPIANQILLEEKCSERRIIRTWTYKELNRAREMRKEGKKFKTIGRVLRRSPSSIAGALRRYGMED